MKIRLKENLNSIIPMLLFLIVIIIRDTINILNDNDLLITYLSQSFTFTSGLLFLLFLTVGYFFIMNICKGKVSVKSYIITVILYYVCLVSISCIFLLAPDGGTESLVFPIFLIWYIISMILYILTINYFKGNIIILILALIAIMNFGSIIDIVTLTIFSIIVPMNMLKNDKNNVIVSFANITVIIAAITLLLANIIEQYDRNLFNNIQYIHIIMVMMMLVILIIFNFINIVSLIKEGEKYKVVKYRVLSYIWLTTLSPYYVLIYIYYISITKFR